MARRKYNITPEMLRGYRPVPGYSGYRYKGAPRTGKLPDAPAQDFTRPIPGAGQARDRTFVVPTIGTTEDSYSVVTRGRSARRFYNPSLPIGDPNREIGDSLYYRLRREYENSPNPEVREYARQARVQDEYTRRKSRHAREIDEIQAQQMNMDVDRFHAIRRELAVYNYTHGIFQQDRMPGGYLATMLEELGWRPRGAPWMVGESGLDHSRTAPNVNPSAQMAVWKSQSSTRGRVA